MKRFTLACMGALAFAAATTSSALALPSVPANSLTQQSADSVVLVRGGRGHGFGRGGRGHHYGWARGRGHHYGFMRGRHRGW